MYSIYSVYAINILDVTTYTFYCGPWKWPPDQKRLCTRVVKQTTTKKSYRVLCMLSMVCVGWIPTIYWIGDPESPIYPQLHVHSEEGFE